jgi:hypothetical protein
MAPVYSFCPELPIFPEMTNDNARREPRVRSRGPVSLVVDDSAAIAATIFDSSPAGLSIDAENGVELDRTVRIEGQGFTGEGIVRYCGRRGEYFRIGLELIPPSY